MIRRRALVGLVALSTGLGAASTAGSSVAAVEAPSGASAVPPRTAALSDAGAGARVRRWDWEPRPANATANRTVPTAGQLRRFYDRGNHWGRCEGTLRRRVTGNFTGTTDEVIQWAAAKWGLPADLVRAEAVVETSWNHGFVGDGGLSYGLMQIKSTASPGTYPMSASSTAFNVDYFAATIRYYYDGCATWMNHQAGRVGTYAAGDLYGSVGAWFSGNWHTEGAEGYIADVKAELADRAWRGL